MVGQMPTTSSFIWGRGGRRRSMDDIALERRLAQQQIAMGSDFSPVGHWTQGLARVANGLAGGLRMRQADNAADERADAQAAILEALSTGSQAEGAPDPVAAALADPELRDIGLAMWNARQPKAQTPPDVVVLSQIANDPNRPPFEREAAAGRLRILNDPQAVIPLPGGAGTYIGPQSGVAAAFGQGARPASPSIPDAAIADLRANPATAAQFDEVFGTGAAQRVLGQGGPTSSASGGFPGR